MKNSFLPAISLVFLLGTVSCVSSRYQIDKEGPAHPPVVLFDTAKVSKYRVAIKVGNTEPTGIMVCKYVDKEWRGSLITETGIKIFDFVSPKEVCRLQNPISFLDKWYIRKTLESDWAFLFWAAGQGQAVKGKSMEYFSDGRFILKNEKRKIEYLFQAVE